MEDVLKVTSIHITEDFYEYKGICTLTCCGKNMTLDLADLSEPKLMQIRDELSLDEDLETIRSTIMEHVMVGAMQQSRQEEGENCL